MEILNYNLDFDINSNDFTYTCDEIIKLKGNEEKLILNTINLDIKKITVNKVLKNFKGIKENQEIVVDGIITSDATVQIKFAGKIPEELQGFYRSKTDNGYMFSTQFESSDARRLFPCIDNPSYKATFDISVTIDKNLKAISNMPVEKEEIINDRKKIKFAQTPRMSTYLLYLGIADFDERSIKFDNSKDLILAAPKNHLTKSDYPLEVGKKSIEFYEKYFDIEYPLPKEHLIAVPEFAAGAMENWGAITFREIFLYLDEYSGSRIKKLIGEVIAHELAHQWFGDLVTMKWWDDLWLNESFATFMAYKTIDHLYPEYDMFSDFLAMETSGALLGDSLVNSHPIEVEVKKPDDISQIFDEISYGKGGSILRMINSFVTDDVFKKGLNLYLNNFKYKNAEGSDLWEYIGKVSDQPVRGVMESFIKQVGYPIIEASLNDNKIKLNQYRFLLNGKKQMMKWKIPLTVKYDSGSESILFDNETMDLDYNSNFIKLNDDETGFYRVLYSDELYKNILNKIDLLSNKDIFGILNDYYSFLLSGKINLDKYIETVRRFINLNNPLIVTEISNELFSLYTLSDNKKIIEINNEFLSSKIKELSSKKESEDINISILRGTLSYRYAIINRGYAEKLKDDINNLDNIDPDMKLVILASYAIATNDIKKLTELLDKSKNDEDKVRIINAMAWLNGEGNYNEINNLIETHAIKIQDSMRYYFSASLNKNLREYIYNNLEKIINNHYKYFAGSGSTSRLVEELIPMVGLNHVDEIESKLNRLGIKEISRGIKKGMEYLNIYNNLMQKINNN